MAAAFAQAAISVSAFVDKVQTNLEDEVLLTVSVNGQGGSDPQLPSMPAFKVIPSGTASSIQIINGSISSSKQYSYVLIPQAEGSFTISPITVTADGKDYKSLPLTITISHSNASIKPAPPVAMPIPNFDPALPQPQTIPQGNGEKKGQDYWIESAVNNKSPYLGEQILFTFRFYTRVQVGSAQLNLPDFKDFWTEEVVPEKKYYQEINGDRFVVSEKVLALHALKTGELSIPETELDVQVPDQTVNNLFNDPFFGFGNRQMKQKHLRAPALTLNVKNLPQPAPDNFTNLVGQFNVMASLSDKEIKTGDSTTLTVVLSGLGNIKEATLPLKIDIPNLKVYEDKAQVETIKTEEGVRGKKTFKVALVPTQAEEFVLPEKTIQFFNPKTESYDSLPIPAFTFKAIPGENEKLNPVGVEPTAIPKNTIAPLEDIATIHTEIGDLTPKSDHQKLFWFIFILFPVFYGLALTASRIKNGFSLNNKKTSRNAFKNLNNALKKNSSSHQVTEAIKQYVIEKLELSEKGLTTAEIITVLSNRGLKRLVIDKLKNFLSDLETANYGSVTFKNSNFASEALKIFKEINKML